jgi:hypothetical protein
VDLTQEQRALRASVRDLLRRHPPADSGRDPILWRLLGEMGVAGLGIPERFGGAGAGPVETAIVAEELGRVLAPAPLLGSAVLATEVILGCGDAEACERLLPRLAAGTAIAALAWTGSAGGWDPARAFCAAAERPGGGWTLTGQASYVLDGDHADVLIVAAQTSDGIGLFEVDPGQHGVARQRLTTMDQTRCLATVHLDDASGRALGPAARPDHAAAPHDAAQPGHGTQPGHAALAQARDLACIALGAEQAGAAARALELTVSYTSSRIQFGRPIASFQAVGHRLADLHVLVRSARALSYQCAADAASASPGWPLRAAAAKAYCSEALLAVAAEMIQLHGAMGITWEHDAHRYFKRAHSTAALFGQPSAHLARIAATVIDG